MNTPQRVFAGFLGLSIILQPAAALAAQLHFTAPVPVTDATTPADVLRQSDEYKDGVLTVDGREYTVDDYGHAALKQPDQGWLCSWFGWWCPSHEVGDITFDKENAEQRVIAQVVSSIHAEMVKDTGRVLPMLGFAYPEPLPAGTVVYQERRENAPMNVLHDSWFFFLDLDPDAMFDHRAQFVLVDVATGEITSKRVYSAPVIGGLIRYMDLTERWTTSDRFYPVDLKDLPPGGDWPLKTQNLPAGDALPVPPKGMPQAAVPGELRHAVADGRLIPVAYAEAAPAAPAAVDPCQGQPRRKVAVTIVGEGPNTRHNDGLVDGEIMGNSEQNMVNMLGDMGVERGDIHRFNPENTPKLDDVFKKIGEITKDLGPCDKVFLYIYGHGTITDENNDDIPDSPSWGIAYGHGESAEYIAKNRWSKRSLIKLMEGMHAQDVNLIIESCYSGSIRDWMAHDAANPPAGTNWHVFLAAGSLKPSYGHGAWDGKPAGAYYTDAMSACASRKLAERGIVNPTIEQIEDVMRECQKEFNDVPTHLINPPVTEEIHTVRYTVSDNVKIKEGDSGVTYAEFTITREPAEDTSVSIEFQTFDSDPEGDVSNYPGPKDYEFKKKGSVTFEPGQKSVVVRVGVNGDTVPEEDETFGVWFPSINEARTVTILDDDKPVTPPASSSAPSAAVSSAGTVTIDGGYVIPMGKTKTFDVNGLSGIGYTLLTPDDGKTVTITVSEHVEVDGAKPVIETKCPTCDDLADQARAQADVCSFLEQELADAKAEIADLDRQLVSAAKDQKAAQDALNAFTNPKSYAESGGKRVTSSDLRAERGWSAGLWAQYKSGGMTAQQLSDAWKEGMSDADRQRFKDEIRKKLEQDVSDASARLDRLHAERDDAAASLGGLAGDLEECNAEFDRLLEAWMSCEDSCPAAEAETGQALTGGEGGGAASSSVSQVSSSSSSSKKPGIADDPNAVKAGFTEVNGTETEVTPIEYRTGDEQAHSRSKSSSSSSKPVAASSSKSSSSAPSAVAPSSSSKSSSAPAVSQCPAGTTSDKAECDQVCGHEGGTCTVSNGCYSCEVAQCPAGTYTNTCPSSCASGCDVVGQDGATQCLQCKKSCTEACAGYAQVGTNWNSYIQTQLNQYTCVSAATVATESTTIGSCACSNQPEVQVDATVPVCKGTPCGDVTCGGSATCQQGEATVTVHCNWGGWKNVGENKFQPVLGQ